MNGKDLFSYGIFAVMGIAVGQAIAPDLFQLVSAFGIILGSLYLIWQSGALERLQKGEEDYESARRRD